MAGSCIKCDDPDNNDMVACDVCKAWFHYQCVGESPGVANRAFKCEKCASKKGKSSGKSGKSGSSTTLQSGLTPNVGGTGGSKPTSSNENSSHKAKSTTSTSSKKSGHLQQELLVLEAELTAKQKALEEEKAIQERKLEIDRLLMHKRLQLERELKAKQLAQERELLEMQLAEEREFKQQQKLLRDKFARERSEISAVDSDQDEGAVGGQSVDDGSILSMGFVRQRVTDWLKKVDAGKNINPAVPQPGLPPIPKIIVDEPQPKLQSTVGDQLSVIPSLSHSSIKSVPMSRHGGTPSGNHRTYSVIPSTAPSEQWSFNAEKGTDQKLEERSVCSNNFLPSQRGSINGRSKAGDAPRGDALRGDVPSAYGPGPTKAQLAARQVLSRKLPIFSGKIEEWPLFYSSFVNSTEACGFTEVENLVRLQECLKGPALEAVRSRLLLPKAVPQVVATLKMLYGRPEQLIHSLLVKVRKTDAPRADRLESFVPFGMAVQELCDHLEAADMYDHLINPILIQELVEKLPAATKREWIGYKKHSDHVTLRTFADFTSLIVSEASEAILVMEPKGAPINKGDKSRAKERGFVHTHIGESVAVTSVTRPAAPCRVCSKENHRTRNCEEFKRMNPTQRAKVLEQWKLCERCLNEHQGWCGFKITCNVGTCRGRHHPLAHREEVMRPQNAQDPVTNRTTSSTGQLHTHLVGKVSVIFRIVPVQVYAGSKCITTLAYLDEGSSLTIAEDSLVSELGVSGKPEPLTLQWTGNIVRQEPFSRCTSLEISGHERQERFQLNEVRTVKKLYLPKQQIIFREVIAQYPHLKGLHPADHTGDEPRLLIGLNNVHLIAPLESRVGNANEPIAVRSHLGWTVYGPAKTNGQSGFLGYHGRCTNEELYELIKQHFTSEDVDVTVNRIPESETDRRARELLETTTVRVNGRFETGLLWKRDDFEFPSSYQMAFSRLCSLEKRLKRNPPLEQAVRQQIEDYQTKNYAHVATVDELASADPRKVWYLPLNVVLNPKKPNKIRLVWDAAAQVQGTSLNSMLLAGPDLLTSLPAIIQHFRERAIGFGGDIREMYHQIRIRQEDTHAQRFLYRMDQSEGPTVFLMDVATFGAACSPASAQYIKNLNATQYADQYPDAATAIIRRHYVDDYLDSVDTEEEAIQRAKQVEFIHSRAGFQIRNWVSNSPLLVRALGEQERTERIPLDGSKDGSSERVLGITWQTSKDVFTFSTVLRDDLMPYLTGSKRPTKRIALSALMSLFDPLGLLAPFTVQGKILLQDLWRSGCTWDDLMDEACHAKWTVWRATLPLIERIEIPRCYLKGASADAYKNLQLHILVDAGEQAYGAVAFFRVVTRDGPHCSIVMAKTKVAPLKLLSIPRLELQAAVMGTRLLHSVLENHEVAVTKRFLWTDSKTVLSWIRSDHRNYKPFVAFRIGEILQETKVDEWRWVPTKANIADILTKWSKLGPVLESDGPWFNGPDFLRLPEENWPEQNFPPPGTEVELKGYHMVHNLVLIEPLIDVSRISRWNVLLRTVCCVFRFISNCRRKIKGLPIEPIEHPRHPGLDHLTVIPLKQEEYERAEMVLWKQAQQEGYPSELSTLYKNRESPRETWITVGKNSILYRLGPFLDEFSIMRRDGRLQAADFVPFDTKFPIILPKGHPITNRVLDYYHQRYGHANKETVVNEVRQRFFVPNLRACVARVMKMCQWCHVKRCKPETPRMAPLPHERLNPHVKPFSYVGIDYFGPVEVAVGRRVEKRWIVLFTCLSVRAIHLEVAHKLDTSSCIMAIRRFVLYRGAPIAFFSDNGTNLRAANKELQEQIRRIDITCANVFTNARTRWSFNPPSAPHMGGVWERMVRSAKATMTALNEDRRMNDEVLLTTIAEAEEIINARPLVYVPQDSANAEAITPNHFIRGNSSGLQDPSIAPTNYAEALRNSYK